MLRRLLAGLFRRSRPRPSAAVAPQWSIIICSIDDSRFARVSANLHERFSNLDFELIRIADAKSLAEGYNRGLAQSRAPLLIFCHDDIELLQADFGQRLLAHMRSFDVLGVAGTTRLVDGEWVGAGSPHLHGQVLQPLATGEGCVLRVFCLHDHGLRPEPGAQAVDGMFIAARREAAQALRFDAAVFDGFHLYDLDFSYRAHLAGYRVGVGHDLLVYHHSSGIHDAAWERYRGLFEGKFSGRLSSLPAGRQMAYQMRVADKAEGLQAFERVLREEVSFH